MAEKFLDKVYQTSGQAEMTQLYDDWAKSYDSEVSGEGYATPARAARLLAALLRSGEADVLTVLDYGCGTGLSGAALRTAGFPVIDGCDPSDGMLAGAAEKGVYRELWQVDPEDPYARDFRFKYDAIAAVGVISAGAAPASVLRLLFDALPQGGRLLFSFNGHTLEDATYMAALDTLLADDRAVLEASEDGEHLPGIGMTSRIMVIRAE